MNTITHALLPVILTRVLHRPIRGRELVWIGIAGALPDLLTPHITLEARLASWSHGLPCWAALTLIALTVSLRFPSRFPKQLAAACSAAYFLHILCDAISGGVNWLHPLGRWIWARQWVPHMLWIPLDVVCFLMCYFLLRVLPERFGERTEPRPFVVHDEQGPRNPGQEIITNQGAARGK